MRANSLPLALQIQPAEAHPTARRAATRRQGWQHGSCTPLLMSKLLRQHLLLQRDLQEDLFSHSKGFFFIPSPLSQTKVRFHTTSQPWKTCSTNCWFFSLSNTRHNTWLLISSTQSFPELSPLPSPLQAQLLTKIFQHWAFQVLSARTDFTQCK